MLSWPGVADRMEGAARAATYTFPAQVDPSYPLMQFLDKNLSLYLYSQHFTGYGESLLRYDERSWALRFGFAIYR
jgi:outer membrane phospholipase A